MIIPKLPAELTAINCRHDTINKDNIWTQLLGKSKGLAWIVKSSNSKPGFFKCIFYHFHDKGIIIDY